MIGYYFSDESWRRKKRADWTVIQASVQALQSERDRILEINEVLVERLKVLSNIKSES